jgi:hypothetical protein
VGGSVYASGVLNIAGFSNVATTLTTLGNKQDPLTSTTDISVRNLTISGVTTMNANVTVNGVLDIDGYANVRTAIDSKQANLTGTTDISVRNVTRHQAVSLLPMALSLRHRTRLDLIRARVLFGK